MGEAFDFLQGESSVYDRVQMDDYIRRNQKPRVPPAPTLVASAFNLNDGTTGAAVTVTWTPVRKDIDYIVRWKKTSDSNYTYERAKTSPHIIRPVETGQNMTVAIAAERRQFGTRSGFSEDVQITASGDTTPPGTPSGLACSTNPTLGTITLTWTAVTGSADLVVYNIYRDTVPSPTTLVAQRVGNSFDDVAVVAGVTYYYRVAAQDRTGNVSGYSNETNCTVAFVGTLSVAPTATCVIDPGTTYTTAVTQPVNLPAGSLFLNATVHVVSSGLVGGAGSVTVRFSVGSVGSFTSNEATLSFTAADQTRAANLKNSGQLTVSGQQNMLYEWKDAEGDISSYQLISPGSIQITQS